MIIIMIEFINQLRKMISEKFILLKHIQMNSSL